MVDTLCVIDHSPYRGDVYFHIGVGFDVAYLSELGKFDGLESEVSGKYESHAFFCVYLRLQNDLEKRQIIRKYNVKKNIVYMDIILGKNGNQPFPLTESSISRHHASFHLDEKSGKMTLRDEKSTNGTYILAKDGTFKRLSGTAVVGMNTTVRLGAKHTFVIKDLVKQTTPPPPQAEDISKLRAIYEAYNTNKMALEAKSSNIMFVRIAALTISATIANLLVSVVVQENIDQTVRFVIQLIVTVIALAISWVLVDMKNKSLIRQKDQNERYFRKNYCCPKCGFHFGPRIYDNILAEGRCPNNNCKCKFTGK